MLKSITVKNFKSIGHCTLDLPDLMVLVGKNAAGKSNIVNVFRFLRDIAQKGVKSALQQQGGFSFLLNSYADSSEALVLDSVVELPELRDFTLPDGTIISADSMKHSLVIQQLSPSSYATTEIFIVSAYKGNEVLVNLSNGNIIYSNMRIKQSVKAEPLVKETARDELLYMDPIWGKDLRQHYSTIGIYDFIPKAIKLAVSMRGNATLDEDGGNINIILHEILGNEEKRRMFLNLLQYVLPHIASVEIDAPREGLGIPTIIETYDEGFRLPSEFFSDGTASVIAIIAALFFQNSPIVVIEEPERYVHPAVMSRLATLFEDAARSRKVIITTHSPDLVRYVAAESLYLVQRDGKNCTTVGRVTDSEDIRSFLAAELQMDTLMANNFYED